MDVIPFKVEHILALRGRLQPMQTAHNEQCTPEFGAQMERLGNTWTGIVDGEVVACAGVIQLWSGRAHLWAYLSEDAGKHMRAITRAVLRKLDEMPFVRYEAEIAQQFPAAHRWVRMMGFRCETQAPMRKFFPDGSSGFLYSKVR